MLPLLPSIAYVVISRRGIFPAGDFVKNQREAPSFIADGGRETEGCGREGGKRVEGAVGRINAAASRRRSDDETARLPPPSEPSSSLIKVGSFLSMAGMAC
jgi:hypothetical protein